MSLVITSLDVSGAIFSFLATYFYVRVDRRAWLLGLVATLLNAVLYGLRGIYADMSLEVFYFASMFYGWYQWSKPAASAQAGSVQHISLKHAFLLTVLAGAGISLLAMVLKKYTPSNVPYLDATTTVLSLVAQWLICRKIIETWMLWFIVDAIYIGLYFYKGIPAHSILLMVYLLMAIMGYWQWHKLMRIADWRLKSAAFSARN